VTFCYALFAWVRLFIVVCERSSVSAEFGLELLPVVLVFVCRFLYAQGDLEL